MEQTTDTAMLLDLIVQPAFSVKDGLIVYANPAALSRTVAVGCPINELLVTGQDAYSTLTSGCLYLTLSVNDQPCGASVTRMGECDIFVLEQETEEAQFQALALAAKELRQPLSNMMIAADRLTPVLNQADTDGLYAAQMKRSLHQMLRLVGNMSDAVRYAVQPQAQLELQNISRLFDEVFEKAAALTAQTDVHLTYTGLSEDILCMVSSEKLERAVYNLLSNAIKFTPAGGHITASLTRHDNILHFTLKDTGSSIPAHILGNVYTRYLRQPGIEDGRHGIGLGLFMVRCAATAHGGAVLIQQPEGGGTQVTMTLAIRQKPDGELRSPRLKVDYAGELDHGLIELADILHAQLYNDPQ